MYLFSNKKKFIMVKRNQAEKAIIRMLKKETASRTGHKNNFLLLSGIVVSSKLDPIELQ